MSGVLNEPSAMPTSRYCLRACGGSAGAIASSISSPPSGASLSGVTTPSTRIDGGAAATRSRSLPDRSMTSSSHPRRRAVCASSPVEARESRPAGRGRGAPALSSLTSASRSSGTVIGPPHDGSQYRARLAGPRCSSLVLQQRVIQKADERHDLPEHVEQRAIKPRARGGVRREIGTGQELPVLQVFGGRVILGKAVRHPLQTLALERADTPAESRRFDDRAELFQVGGDVLADSV